MRRTTTIRSETRARRAAERGLAQQSCASTPFTTTPEQHVQRIAKLRKLKRQLAERLAQVSSQLDVAYLAARREKVPHAEIAHAVQLAEGRPRTADDLEQLEAEIRKATHHARRRCDPQRIETILDGRCAKRETARMRNSNTPYRRRVVETEEWYGQPPPEALGEPGPVPSHVGDDDLGDPDDDDLDDGDLGDAEQDDDLDDEDE